MADRISTRNLVNAMRAVGFVDKSRYGSHLVLRHQSTGLLLTIPTDRSFVPVVHIQAIKQQLRNYRIEVPHLFDAF